MWFPFDRLAVFGLALALDLLLGDPPNRWHPVAWMGRLIGWGERAAPATRPGRRFAYGAAVVLAGAAVCTLPVAFVLAGTRHLGAVITVPIAALLL